MHWFNVVSVFTVVMLIGVEFSVFAFVNPAAWRLDPEPQMKLLSRFVDFRFKEQGDDAVSDYIDQLRVVSLLIEK